MFTDADRQNLIKELNRELETSTFYKNPLISEKTIEKAKEVYGAPTNVENSMNKISGNIAFSDTVFGSGVILDDIKLENKNVDVNFVTDGLFRPLVNKEVNALNSKVYNYTEMCTTPVHGMAFESNKGVNVENPLAKPCNIVNNVYETSPSWNEAREKANAEIREYKTKKSEKEIYKMSDVLKETKDEQVKTFATMPKEVSLVSSSSKLKSILFKQIDLKGFLLQDVDLGFWTKDVDLGFWTQDVDLGIWSKDIDLKGFLMQDIDIKGALKNMFGTKK